MLPHPVETRRHRAHGNFPSSTGTRYSRFARHAHRPGCKECGRSPDYPVKRRLTNDCISTGPAVRGAARPLEPGARLADRGRARRPAQPRAARPGPASPAQRNPRRMDPGEPGFRLCGVLHPFAQDLFRRHDPAPGALGARRLCRVHSLAPLPRLPQQAGPSDADVLGGSGCVGADGDHLEFPYPVRPACRLLPQGPYRAVRVHLHRAEGPQPRADLRAVRRRLGRRRLDHPGGDCHHGAGRP